MAHEVYVDCQGRSPQRAVEAVRRDIGALRPGANVVIVQTRDPKAAEAVMEWGASQHLYPVIEHRGGRRIWLRFVLLPRAFGGLPDCTQRELCRARGTRTPLTIQAAPVLV